jgi:hypothetical protein
VAVARLAADLLRVTRGEVQLTSALQRLMKQDPRLADKMVSGLLELSARSTIDPPRPLVVKREDPTSRKLVLRAARPTGRIDWRFFDTT